MITQELLTAFSGFLVVLLGVATYYLRKHLGAIKGQVTPNGGKSLYDQATQATDLSRKALEMSIQLEREVRELKTKIDALILSGIPKG